MRRIALGVVTLLAAFGAALAEQHQGGVIPIPQQRPEMPIADAIVPIPRLRPERYLVNGWAALERRDYAEAARLYREAAGQGLADAQYSLGLMYVTGEGVPQDSVEAMKWFRKAAEQGRANAQFVLGSGYALGDGVPQDFTLAYIWYDLSAAQNYEMAREYRDDVANQMTVEQVAKARRLTREQKHRTPDFPFVRHGETDQGAGVHPQRDFLW